MPNRRSSGAVVPTPRIPPSLRDRASNHTVDEPRQDPLGRLFVLIGPGGSGKTAIIAAVLACRSEVRFVPTTTTRPPRPGEASGREYFFVSPQEFQTLTAAGALLEWQAIHGNLYGLQRARVEQLLADGRRGITALDFKGSSAVCKAFPGTVTTIFVQPSSLQELRDHLASRPGAIEHDIASRLLRAQEELRHAHEFDYLVTNPDGCLDAAVAKVLQVIAGRSGQAKVLITAAARTRGTVKRVALGRRRQGGLYCRWVPAPVRRERWCAVPTIHQEAGFTFSFYSADRLHEPPHVHVRGSGGSAKVWLSPVSLEWESGLTGAEVRTIMQIVNREASSMLEKWFLFGVERG